METEGGTSYLIFESSRVRIRTTLMIIQNEIIIVIIITVRVVTIILHCT